MHEAAWGAWGSSSSTAICARLGLACELVEQIGYYNFIGDAANADLSRAALRRLTLNRAITAEEAASFFGKGVSISSARALLSLGFVDKGGLSVGSEYTFYIPLYLTPMFDRNVEVVDKEGFTQSLADALLEYNPSFRGGCIPYGFISVIKEDSWTRPPL